MQKDLNAGMAVELILVTIATADSDREQNC